MPCKNSRINASHKILRISNFIRSCDQNHKKALASLIIASLALIHHRDELSTIVQKINSVTDVQKSGGGGRGGAKERRIPAAIIIGARKAGTRALLEMINLHSKVHISHYEVHFFGMVRF